MHKELLILGLAGDFGPISGYDLHRIVRAHGELFSDLKKPNMYHLLEGLARRGFLRVRTQTGTRGRRGEKLLYSLTPSGRKHFEELLAREFTEYDTVYTGMEVASVFLSQISRRAALELMQARRDAIVARRGQLILTLGRSAERGPLTKIAADHLMTLVDAELGWVDRSLRTLRESPKRRRT